MRSTSPLRALPPGRRTLPALLELQADSHGDRPIVRADGVDLTVAELRDRVARRAGCLASAGIEPGDAVASLSENRLELVELWLACAWLGALYVPVNTALRGGQLAHVLHDAGVRLLVAEPELLPVLEPVRAELPALGQVWRIDDYLDYGAPLPPVEAAPGDACTVLYTSGTTGPSKGVLCPNAQWYWWGVATSEVLGVRAGDVLYTCLPLFHTNALNTFVQALVAGAVFAPGPRFSASQLWRRLAESQATVTYLLGAMIHILSSREPDPFEREHRVRIALAPATPSALCEPFRERFGIELVDGWGSTEANVVLATTPVAPPGSMGSVVRGFEARVVDEHDEPVPAGAPGELVVRSDEPYAFANGYLGLPDKTLESWRNLWLHTGDRVVRDEAGWFWFVDRMKDSIRRRGENVSSYEVEAVLAAHPDVAAAAVVPTPSELGEDEVLAFVVLREGATLDPVELVRFCEPRLAYFAIPRFVELVDELPLTANGKIEKFRLRERGVSERTWDREAAGSRSTSRPTRSESAT
jgi:crotonobetaine/carnitine-CoA ligase